MTTCLITLLLVSTWAALATTYVYDSNGRLAVVTNDAGESDRYRYDELGNLITIERLAADDVAVFGFSPGRGAAGVAVRISGHGFSPTVGQNTVRFNGAVASVSTATNNALTAIVPAGATTGPITVTVGGETASSTTPFVVDANAKPPVITNVSPVIASVGTAITVDGQVLAPVANQTTLRLNQRPALPTSLTNIRAVFAVPAGTSSGRVSVTTPYGTDFSDQDVLVTPSGVLPGEIAQLRRLAIDATAQGFSVATTGHYGAALFDGDQGEYLSAQFSSVSVASISYTLYSISNTVLASGTVSTGSPTFHLPKLPARGTYLLLMKPATRPATWNVAIEKTKPITANGDQLPVATTAAGQSKRLIFTATAGQNLGLGISNLVVNNGSYVGVTVYKPNGSTQIAETCPISNNGCGLNLENLAAGTYSVKIEPASSSQTMSFKTTLSTDNTATLARDMAYVLSLPRRGQNGRLRFAGTAGETVKLNVAGQTTVPAGRNVSYMVLNPDGTTLTSTNTTLATTLNLPNLAATGTYTMFVDPAFGETLSAHVTLTTTSIIGEMTVNGASGSFATTVPGQNVYLTFTASAGQNMGLGISDLLTPGSATYVFVDVYKPDGYRLEYDYCYASANGCEINLPDLVAGTYSVIIRPPEDGDQTMSFKSTLSTDSAATLTRNTAYALSLPRRGQNGRLTFAGTRGETVALQVVGQATVPANRATHYIVLKPDGTTLTSTSTNSSTTLNLPNLPATGTYNVFVDPAYGETLTAQVMLATGTTGRMLLNGASGSFATTIPGQNVYLTFAATAGQNLGLGISDLETPGTTENLFLQVFGPDGETYGYESCSVEDSGCQVNLPNLAAGTYNVIIRPPGDGNQTMSFKSTLSTDKTATLARSTAYALSLPRRGQNGRLTFAGTAGETMLLQAAGQATEPAGGKAYYTVLKPDGTTLASMETTSAKTLNLPNLPATGTYTVFVDPEDGETLSAQVTLATGIAGEIVVDGASGSFATTVSGQNIYLTFTATAGQNMGLGISDLVTPGTTSSVVLRVFKPDGSYLPDQLCAASLNGCQINLPNLMAGTYRVVITPPSDGERTMSLKTTLSTDKTAMLTRNTAYALSLSRRGQNGRLTFAGTAGETVLLEVAGQATVPADRTAYYRVHKPNGTYLYLGEYMFLSINGASARTLRMQNLPVTGNYMVLVDSQYGETVTSQVTVRNAP